jgi:hypothetical protein
MKVINDNLSLLDFDAWSGAKDTKKTILDNGKGDDFDSLIDKVDLMYEYIESQSSLFTTQQYDLFNKILVKMAGQFMSEDKKYGILVMFSYDYFDKTHMFLRDLIQNKIINNDILEELENNISQ